MKKLVVVIVAAVAACLILWGTRPTSEEPEINRLGGRVAYNGRTFDPSAWLAIRTGSRFLREPYDDVAFSSDTLTDDDFTSLKLIGVSTLFLQCPRLTLLTAKHISTRSDVRELYIRMANVDDEWVAEIVKSRQLEVIDVQGSQVSDSSAAELSRMPNLRILSVADTPMTSAGLLQILDAPKLEGVFVDNDQVSHELTAKCQSRSPSVRLELK